METIRSPKHQFKLERHGTKAQKASVIDTAVKAFQRTVFFNDKLYPSMERLSNSDSMVTQLWNTITLRNPEDGDNTFSKTSVRTRATQYKVPEDIYNPKTCLVIRDCLRLCSFYIIAVVVNYSRLQILVEFFDLCVDAVVRSRSLYFSLPSCHTVHLT
jgi:hypothetical protein